MQSVSNEAAEHAAHRIKKKCEHEAQRVSSDEALREFYNRELDNEEAKLLIARMNLQWRHVPARGWIRVIE